MESNHPTVGLPRPAGFEDVVALTCGRPHRPARSPEVALEEVLRGGGTEVERRSGLRRDSQLGRQVAEEARGGVAVAARANAVGATGDGVEGDAAVVAAVALAYRRQ
jgi:hypothetical protein